MIYVEHANERVTYVELYNTMQAFMLKGDVLPPAATKVQSSGGQWLSVVPCEKIEGPLIDGTGKVFGIQATYPDGRVEKIIFSGPYTMLMDGDKTNK